MGYHGRNVVTDNPGVGDILCYDENRKYKFIVLDTYHAGTFPAAWETLGVVTLRKGNKVTVCSKHNASKKFMEVFPYIVTGYTLDGTEHMATLKLHGSDTFEFKYTANTDNEFVEALKSFLIEHGFSDWSAYIMDGKVILQYDNYTSAETYNSDMTCAEGVTLTDKFAVDLTKTGSNFWRKCGNRGNGVWHAAKAKETFVSDNSGPAYNPSSDVTAEPAYPVCWPAFAGTSRYQDDHCLWLRLKYCENPECPTLDEWKAYIDELEHIVPYMLGCHAPGWRDGHVLSDTVKHITYQAVGGTTEKLYSAIAYCAGFMDGQGYLPSMTELIEAFGNVTYGLAGVAREESDPINRSLYAIGGNAVPCNVTYWNACRYMSGNAWVADGGGKPDGYSMHISCRAVPFATLELPLTE